MAPQWCASVYINHTFVFHFLSLSANVKYAIKQSFIDNFTGRHRHHHHHFLQCRRRRHRHRSAAANGANVFGDTAVLFCAFG